MSGARKKVYQDFHLGGRGNTPHGSESPSDIGPTENNQAAPGLHMVGRVPSDGHLDENFRFLKGEGEKDS